MLRRCVTERKIKKSKPNKKPHFRLTRQGHTACARQRRSKANGGYIQAALNNLGPTARNFQSQLWQAGIEAKDIGCIECGALVPFDFISSGSDAFNELAALFAERAANKALQLITPKRCR